MTVLLVCAYHCSASGRFSSSVRVLLVVVAPLMGCGGSKVEHLPLVTLCRERKDLLKAASEGRYALATAHLSYFRSLNEVGEALCRFVDEELLIASSASSSSSTSPALTLPSEEGKRVGPKRNTKRRKKKKVHLGLRSGIGAGPGPGSGSNKHSSSTSMSHSVSTDNSRHRLNPHRSKGIEVIEEEEEEDDEEALGEDNGKRSGHMDNAHLQLSDSDSDASSTSSFDHIHVDDSPVLHKQKPFIPAPGMSYSPAALMTNNPNPYNSYANNSYDPYPSLSDSLYPSYQDPYPSYGYSSNPQYQSYPPNSYNSYPRAYYMKKSSPAIPSVIYEEPKQNPIFTHSGYSGYPNYPSGVDSGYFDFMMNSGSPAVAGNNRQQSQQPPPPTPPSPKVSTWDFFNPFEAYDDNAYAGYFSQARFGYGSDSSSPDSREVREREGIPELEEETETEVMKETYREKNTLLHDHLNKFGVNKNKNAHFEESSGDNFGEGTFKPVPLHRSKEAPPVEVNEVKSSSPESIDSTCSLSKNSGEVFVKKKEVNFEVDGSSLHDVASSKLSSLTTLSASAHGTRDLREVFREIKNEFEVASDYGKEVSLLLEVGRPPYKSRHTFLRVMLARVLHSIAPPSSSPQPTSTFSSSLHSSIGNITRDYAGDSGNSTSAQSLASTLEKLYVWEKKLYKEVKDEERLRVAYEKLCKKLKVLDEQGADNSKIEATQAAIKKLLTKINVSIRSVVAISNRIHKLRDEELHPQLRELICGLRRMWKAMLKCHQKQFRAVLESKMRILRAHAFSRKESSVKATFELEMELQNWCGRFLEWVEKQRSYAETLNGWLLRSLTHETEETSDGPVPFSPGRIGAPPTFVVCHDWKQAMERVSESVVQTAMHDFATSLHKVLERQDEELHQKLRAEYVKHSKKQGRAHHVVWTKMQHEHDAISNKTATSMIPSESGISLLDDLKVDLDSIKQRSGNKEGVRAVSRSIQAGVVPIFEALESFTSEALKAYEDVRVEGAGGGS